MTKNSGLGNFIGKKTLPEPPDNSGVWNLGSQLYTKTLNRWFYPQAGVFITTAGAITYDSGGYRYQVFLNPGNITIDSSSTIFVDYLVVAGGGSGGSNGGGAGAGGFRTGSQFELIGPAPFPITVGSGGAFPAGSGNPSIFSTISSTGGGRGSSNSVDPAPNLIGGSGGGGASSVPGPSTGIGGSGNVGGYTPPEGNPGGNGFSRYYPGTSLPSNGWAAGGGGGASESGGTGNTITPIYGKAGNGGNGSLAPWVPAIPVSYGSPRGYFSGGGGGSVYYGDPILDANAIAGTGGIGGGGVGAVNPAQGPTSPRPIGASGVVNTGGGGGGWSPLSPVTSGGSGIVIIRYPWVV